MKHYLNEALKIDKNNLKTLYRIAFCYFNLEKFDDSKNTIKKALDICRKIIIRKTLFYLLIWIKILIIKLRNIKILRIIYIRKLWVRINLIIKIFFYY